MSRRTPSLVELCIKIAIDNLSHIRDVGDTDINLLKEILSKCTAKQLSQIENASKGRDLSLVTNVLWNQLYIQRFGAENANLVIENGDQENGYSINWRQIYDDKSKELGAIPINIQFTRGRFKGSRDQLKEFYKKHHGNIGDFASWGIAGIFLVTFVLAVTGLPVVGFVFITIRAKKAFQAADYETAVALVFADIFVFFAFILPFLHFIFRHVLFGFLFDD